MRSLFRPGATPDTAVADVARTTTQLAVLLGAGVAPANAWAYVAELAVPAEDGGSADTGRLASIAEAARSGDDVSAVIGGDRVRTGAGRARQGDRTELWSGLAAAWQVATTTGAPLGVCLRDLSASFRALDQIDHDVGTALAGPAATAKLVLWLPVVSVLLGAALGFDTIRTLFATIPGLICLFAGSACMFAGWRWSAALARRACLRDPSPGLSLDLVAVAMAGGGSATGARAVAATACERFGLAFDDAGVDRVLRLSTRAGVPAGELLRSEADQCREQALTDGQRAAAVLATRLMIPLGVCVLPAFMVIGVAPLLLSVLAATSVGW
ncbi:type II secretion system F family protein [Plantibacter sp. YIM 135249]|uniref:type II secretion system F family protein n=1 Tax=Plantibacter sp. YIM 135249 TaxID=3423918 RepID=UPI003D335E55